MEDVTMDLTPELQEKIAGMPLKDLLFEWYENNAPRRTAPRDPLLEGETGVYWGQIIQVKTALKKQIEEYPRLEGESALRWLDRLNAKSEEERKAHETSMLQWGALAGFVAAIVNPFTGIVVFLLGLLYPSKRK